MPRAPRVEYAGAVYHIMNRGDGGDKVFWDELDYGLFERRMAEVCGRCGWRLHSWVLMPNHFHWLLETPEANLVAGMKWFMGAYSIAFNGRHGHSGHVFGGRYKAVLIDGDSGDHFARASTYIHLNPARAHLLAGRDAGLDTFIHSSYPSYLQPKSKRREWLCVDRVLGNLGLKDSVAGRRRYADYLNGRVQDLRSRKGREEHKEECKQLRYGWYVGEDTFRDELLARTETSIAGKSRESYNGGVMDLSAEQHVEKYLRKLMKAIGVTDRDLDELPKGAAEKRVLAWAVRRESMMSNAWLAERLRMGVASNMSALVASVTGSPSATILALHKRVQDVKY